MTGTICCWKTWDKHYCSSGHCCWPYACLRALSARIPCSLRNFPFCPETHSQSFLQLSLVRACGFQSYKGVHVQFVGQQSWLPLIKQIFLIQFGKICGVLLHWPQWNPNFPWHHYTPKSQEYPWGHSVLTVTQNRCSTAQRPGLHAREWVHSLSALHSTCQNAEDKVTPGC